VSELDPVIKSIQAAKLANESAINVLNAVLLLLSPETMCTHESIVQVQTMAGTVSVCDCGETFPESVSQSE